MNWEVRQVNKPITEEWDHCEHLKVGDIAPYVIGEQDSFGPVYRLGLCSKCNAERKEQEEQVTEICYDCGESKPMKEINSWKPYDFYAPQGDTPYLICDDCWDKPKHQQRRDRDSRDEEEENGRYY